jgi:hypothetical protein
MFGRVSIACLSLLALLARPTPAEACSCSRPGVVVTPNATAPAPTNAVVRVTWWVGPVKLDESSLQLVAAGKTPQPVVTTQRSLQSGDQRTVLLTPSAPLEPATRYEVLGTSAPGGKPGVVGAFTTADAADTAAPTWSGVKKAAYVHEPAVCCNCSTGSPYVRIDLASGDKLEPGLVFGVWVLPEGEAKAAKDAPPTALVDSWSGVLYLGHKSTCSPRNFELGGKSSTLTLRVAPIDTAWNLGTSADLTVEIKSAAGKPAPAPAPGKPAPAPAPGKPAPAPAPGKPAPAPAPGKPAPGKPAPAPAKPTTGPAKPAPGAAAPTAAPPPPPPPPRPPG